MNILSTTKFWSHYFTLLIWGDGYFFKLTQSTMWCMYLVSAFYFTYWVYRHIFLNYIKTIGKVLLLQHMKKYLIILNGFSYYSTLRVQRFFFKRQEHTVFCDSVAALKLNTRNESWSSSPECAGLCLPRKGP